VLVTEVLSPATTISYPAGMSSDRDRDDTQLADGEESLPEAKTLPAAGDAMAQAVAPTLTPASAGRSSDSEDGTVDLAATGLGGDDAGFAERYRARQCL
jgi:hypothetical protein